MFHRIMNGTTTEGDAHLVGLIIFLTLMAGIAIGAFILQYGG